MGCAIEKVTRARVPEPKVLVRLNCPPCNSVKRLTSAKPNPLPRDRFASCGTS